MKSASLALRLPLLLVLASVLSGSSCTWKFHSGDDDHQQDGGGTVVVETATFGGWDLATVLGARSGVLSVTSGWNGSLLPFLGEPLVGWTGHAHVSRVRFDPARVSFAELVGAVRAVRHASLRMSVYAHSPAQEHDAAQQFPPDSLPRLRLRTAGSFVPAD
jgi:hypothetical protein